LQILIPVCPEILGGLGIPREPAEQKGRLVFTKSGKNVTENFMRGAEEVLKIALLFNIKEAILKQGSPSCGNGIIFDGTFSDHKVTGYGITAKLLRKNGIRVISEIDL